MAAKFGYRGDRAPVHWGSICSDWSVADNGKRQSPIDILTSKAVQSEELNSLKYNWHHDTQIKLVNTGHSPTWTVTPGRHTLTGGPLTDTYEMVQFHIHFSHDRKHGCEHTINGQSHSAEIHFVHFKKEYGSFGEALKHSDGLAVVGAFLDVTDDGDEHKLLSADLMPLSEVTNCKSSTAVNVNLAEYMLPTDKFYTYPGSLTTPGCAECVVWLVLDEPLLISGQAYGRMTSLESVEGGLLSRPGNYRPVQPVHGRTVKSSFNTNKIL
ncbi:CA2 [Bugula neritina]|uniref:carbonic anhydrase n=1 Tax=Bugula neritina TaxID=10212 RepID=A0A7J7K7R3_BUGNE|nr:CA2 [Bugula neritina]